MFKSSSGVVKEKSSVPRPRVFNMPRLALRFYPWLYRTARPTFKYGGKFVDWFVGRDEAILTWIPNDANIVQIPVDENVEQAGSVVLPAEIIEHFIREAGAVYIMNYCPCRDVTDCKDYPRDIGCMWIGGAVSDIAYAPEVGYLATTEQALEHLQKARDAGLVQLVGKWSTDARLMGVARNHRRFITLCNCCPCCCVSRPFAEGGPELMSEVFHKLPGLTVTVDLDKCEGCGTCAKTCEFKNITVVNKKSTIGDNCKGCGMCATVCPNKAITLTLEDPTYVEAMIKQISSVVDVT